MKIAIATVSGKGLQDIVSPEFGHARTFTIIEIQDKKIVHVDILENPAGRLTHGRGPLVAKKLADLGVETVISGEIGPGAQTILEQLGIKRIIVKPGQKVEDILRENNFIE